MDVDEQPIDNATILEAMFNVSFSDEEPTDEQVQHLTALKRVIDALALKLKKQQKKTGTTVGGNVISSEFQQKLLKYSSILVQTGIDVDAGMYFIYILIYIIY